MKLSTMKMAAALARQYDRDFAPLQEVTILSRLPTSDVHTLFKAAALVAFYLPGGEYMAATASDYGALGRRGATTPAEDTRMYEAYIDGRDFDAARSLRRAHPAVGSGILPRIVDRRVDSALPSVLTLSPDERHLVRETYFPRGKRIVILSSPLCHFCQRASRELDVDPRFQSLLHKYATWLIPPDGSSFEMIHAWNERHPFEAMVQMYGEGEWPMIEDIATPTFFFFDGSKLVARVTGWPTEGNKPAILAAMRKLGIAVPSPI